MRERKVCAGVMPLRPVWGFFRPRARSWAHLLDQRGMVVQEPGDALQERVEVDALVAQFEIGEAELGCGDTGHAFFSGRNSSWFNSQMRSKAALSLR
jgi:hypothetical protein